MLTQIKKHTLLFLGFICLIVVFACRKEISNVFENEDYQKTQWAKDYFTNVLLKNKGNQAFFKDVNKTASTMGVDKIPNMKTPLWNYARASQTKLFTFVEIPLKYSQKILRSHGKSGEKEDAELAKGSFDRLIIYKNKKGEINQRIVSYIPDKEYLERHNGDISHNKIDFLDRDFSGFLRYSDWDGNVLFRLRVNNGVAKKLRQKQSGETIKTNSVGNKLSGVNQKSGGNKVDSYVEVCVDIIEYEWTQTCYYDNPDDPLPRYCSPPILVSQTVIGEICDFMYVYDPNDCSDPANFENAECGSNSDPNPVDTSTVNVTDSCIKAGLDMALGSGVKSQILSLMAGTFLENQNINLSFSSFAFNIYGPNANADAYTAPWSASQPYSQQIAFNTNLLSHKSQEYIVATVYHEVLHAYLGNLFAEDTNGILIVPDQHEDIVWNYLSMLTSDLKSVFPNLSDTDANALAWGGLERTSKYALLTQTQKDNINLINQQYSTKTSTSNITSKGSYCK